MFFNIPRWERGERHPGPLLICPTALLRRESGSEARKAKLFAQGVYIDVHDRSEKRSLTQHTARYLALKVGV